MTDIEIERSIKLEKITEVAQKKGIGEEFLELYGKYKAKISNDFIEKTKGNEDGKLVLVTAINPTPLGEGKTTVAIGLSDALNKIGKNSILALREPSLRTSIWNKRRSNRRRVCTGCSNGGYKSTFYRRYTCHNNS